MADKDKRGGDRVPVALRLKLRYTDVETFIDKYAANVSRGGIFISSRAPKAVGSVLRFEFQLADGSPVVRGEGKVVWVKEFDAARPKKPHGMGIKFTRLDRHSKAILDRMLVAKGQARSEGSGPLPIAEGSGPLPLPADDSAPRPLPADDSGPLPITDSGPLPITDSGPLPITDRGPLPVTDSGPLPMTDSGPLPVADSGPLPVADSAPLPITDSGPLPITEESAARPESADARAPATAAESSPLPVTEGSSPHARVIAPTTPVALMLELELQPALDALDRLAVELGFTDEALAAAMVRARELAAGANGDVEALLRAPAGEVAPPPNVPATRAPTPPPAALAPGVAHAAALASSFDEEEITDVDRAMREARALGHAEPATADEAPSLDLASPDALGAGPRGGASGRG